MMFNHRLIRFTLVPLTAAALLAVLVWLIAAPPTPVAAAGTSDWQQMGGTLPMTGTMPMTTTMPAMMHQMMQQMQQMNRMLQMQQLSNIQQNMNQGQINQNLNQGQIQQKIGPGVQQAIANPQQGQEEENSLLRTYSPGTTVGERQARLKALREAREQKKQAYKQRRGQE